MARRTFKFFFLSEKRDLCRSCVQDLSCLKFFSPSSASRTCCDLLLGRIGPGNLKDANLCILKLHNKGTILLVDPLVRTLKIPNSQTYSYSLFIFNPFLLFIAIFYNKN